MHFSQQHKQILLALLKYGGLTPKEIIMKVKNIERWSNDLSSPFHKGYASKFFASFSRSLSRLLEEGYVERQVVVEEWEEKRVYGLTKDGEEKAKQIRIQIMNQIKMYRHLL